MSIWHSSAQGIADQFNLGAPNSCFVPDPMCKTSPELLHHLPRFNCDVKLLASESQFVIFFQGQDYAALGPAGQDRTQEASPRPRLHRRAQG